MELITVIYFEVMGLFCFGFLLDLIIDIQTDGRGSIVISFSGGGMVHHQ
jgi:hypothetical protein